MTENWTTPNTRSHLNLIPDSIAREIMNDLKMKTPDDELRAAAAERLRKMKSNGYASAYDPTTAHIDIHLDHQLLADAYLARLADDEREQAECEAKQLVAMMRESGVTKGGD